MKVTIESIVSLIDKEATAMAFTRILNTVLLARTEDELRKSLKKQAENNNIDYYFAWGFGSSHFWLKQRLSCQSGQIFDTRVLMARF